MALTHAILAILRNNALSGYDLWKNFSKCTNCYWQASQQQVYRELHKLESQSAITSELVPQVNRPNKKLYRITSIGKEILITWVAKPSKPMAVREELLVKVLAAHLVSPDVIIQELKRRRQIHFKKLTACQEMERKMLELPAMSIEEKCQHLTLRLGIRHEKEWIAWCEEAVSIFSSAIVFT